MVISVSAPLNQEKISGNKLCYHLLQVEFLTSNGRHSVETMFDLKTTSFNTMTSYYLSQKPKLMGKVELIH